MNDPTGSSYLPPWPLGEPASGGGVGKVLQSRSQKFQVGDILESFMWPWQEFVVFSGEDPSLHKVEMHLHCSLMSIRDLNPGVGVLELVLGGCLSPPDLQN